MLVGIDVGGTNIGFGTVAADHSVHERHKVPTPTHLGDLLDELASGVTTLGGEAVGLAVPAIIDRGRVVQVPNIAGWTPDTDVAAELTARTGLAVTLVNDAQAGLLGEWQAGAAAGDRWVLGVWLGTGVGGGLVLDGRSYPGAGGGSGELGHLVVRPDGARCGCGRRGCLEAYAGRRMMTDSVAALAAAGRPTRLFELQRERGKEKATSGVWAAAVRAGDETALEVLAEATDALGLAVASCANLLDLDRIVVGGGMAGKLGDRIVADLLVRARASSVRPLPDGLVVVSALGDDAGIVGAAQVAREAASGTLGS